MKKTASIVVIGDEILSGKFAEENATFLVGQLRDLGVRLQRISVIRDASADIVEVVNQDRGRYDWVFTSGGIGPTHDDVTIDALAEAFGVPVTLDPTFLALVKKHYGDPVTADHERLARVPQGAALIDSPTLPVPVLSMANVFVFPGVPSLLRKKFLAIREMFRQSPTFHQRVFLNADEAQIVSLLNRVVAQFPSLQFGSYPRFENSPHSLILTIEGDDQALVSQATRTLNEAMRDFLPDRPLA